MYVTANWLYFDQVSFDQVSFDLTVKVYKHMSFRTLCFPP